MDCKSSFEKVTSPNEAGYYVKSVSGGYGDTEDNVKEISVTPEDKSIEITVTYATNGQEATIKYIDDDATDPADKIIDSGESTGKYHSDINFEKDPQTEITNLENKGYVLVDNNTNRWGNGNHKYQSDNEKNQFEIHFKHGTVTVGPKHPVDPGQPINPNDPDPDGPKYPEDTKKLTVKVPRTIQYVYQNGKQAQPDKNDKLKFNRTMVINKVTGEVKSDTWTKPQDFETIASPTIQGYTPDWTEVADKNIGHDHPAINEKVTYNPDAQKAVVRYIDDTTGEQLSAQDLKGYSDQSTGYNTKKSIDGYVAQHYVLVSDDTNGETIVLDYDDSKDQSYEVHFKHGTELANDSRTKKITVHYQHADGLTHDGKAADDQTAKNLTFKRTGTHDLVTDKFTWNDWDKPTQTFDEIDSPAIEGYTPDQANISNVTVTADSPETTEKTVIYHANPQTAQLHFIDDTTGKPLPKSETTNGVSDAGPITLTNGEQDLQYYLDRGYEFVNVINDTAKVSLDGDTYANAAKNFGNFDHDDDQDQSFTVHLEHGTVTVTPKTPGNPGDPINPNDPYPDGPKYPEGTNKDSLTKQVKRTINYVNSDDTPSGLDPHHDSLSFEHTLVIDKVNGEVLKDTWTSAKDFPTIESPAEPGYTPDRTIIPGVKVDHTDNDITETVTYTPDAQKATVKYIDDSDNGKLLKADNLTGRSNEDSGYTTKSLISTYEGQGYQLVSDSTDGHNVVFDHDDNVDQVYEVHLVHATEPVTDTQTVTRTVHYVYPDGTPVKLDTVQTVTFTRTGTKDKVTKQTSWNPWTPTNKTLVFIVPPIVPDYQPDTKVVPPVTVTSDTPDIVVTVTYTKVVTPTPGQPSQPGQPKEPGQPTPGEPEQNELVRDKTDVNGKTTGDDNLVQNGENNVSSQPVEMTSSTKQTAKKNQLPQTGSQTSKTGVLGLGGKRKRN
ncbi:hypothetical protein H9564_08950 [Limosilactobacillus sp. Sa3CUN2]|uniref:Mucin binding domain-containing protein n=1 Tax=Limosilactobacillus avistercoris TaxID=2762243 RepID=A0ABR8PF28_9LACO|nr:hypothetical protein [Limosilactobacillus avistercoris]MBD7895798.1 hypothetical protein [Limosilactobacillus avistercoris]